MFFFIVHSNRDRYLSILFFFLFELQILKVVPTCETRYRTTWLTSCQILEHRCTLAPFMSAHVDPFLFSPYVYVSLHARSLPPSFLHLTFLPSFLLTPCQMTDGSSTAPPPTFRPRMPLPPHALSPPTKVLISPYLRSFRSFLASFLHTFLFFLR